MNDVFIRLLESLPHETLGVTVPDPDGDYNIYLNPAYDQDTLRKTVDHEIRHIQCGHLEKDGRIDDMELDAEGENVL